MKQQQTEGSVLSMLGMVWTIGFVVTVPLVGFALLGRFVDQKFNTQPLFFLVGIVFAIILSTIMVYRKTVYLMDEAEKQTIPTPQK